MPQNDKRTSSLFPSLHMHNLPRSPYALLITIYASSRIAYYLLGVRFDALGLDWFYQFLDPELLKRHLAQSLFYLHMQPPGYNLYLGVVLKLFPNGYSAAFHVVNLTLGATVSCILFYLMRSLGVGTRLSAAATAFFIISPGVVLFENFILFDYMLLFLLLASAAFLMNTLKEQNAASAIGFLLCQFCLVMIRNSYHLIYFASIFAALLFITKQRIRRAVAIAGSILLVVAGSLFIKNQILFDQFSSSSWLGIVITTVTSHQLSDEEGEYLIAEGRISPASVEIRMGSPISDYSRYIAMPLKTSIPALDQEEKASGAANFNHKGFLQVQKLFVKDGLFILRHYPKAYLRSVAIAWFAYFLPTDDFFQFNHNAPRIRGIQRAFDVMFFGQFKQAPGDELRRLYASGAGISLLLYTGTFLMAGLPALFIFGIYFLYRGIRSHTLEFPRAAVIGFMIFNIMYITMISNFLSSFENNRYRFSLDGFYVTLAALALNHVRRKRIRKSIP